MATTIILAYLGIAVLCSLLGLKELYRNCGGKWGLIIGSYIGFIVLWLPLVLWLASCNARDKRRREEIRAALAAKERADA